MHTFLVEFIQCGFTTYDVNGFQDKFRLLCNAEPELAGLSRLERQFQVSITFSLLCLKQNCEFRPLKCIKYFVFLQILCEMKNELYDSREKDGLSIENRYKNRDMDVIPST